MSRLLVLMLLLSSLSFARANGPLTLPDTLYMNAYYERTSKDQADLVRIMEGRDADSVGYFFREYDKDGRLTKTGITKELYGHPRGMIASYYENGIKKDEGYLETTRKGLWKEWYQNGQLKEEVKYEEDKKGTPVLTMIHYNDSLGKKMVINGAGLFEEYYQNDIYGQLKTKGKYHNFHRAGTWEGFKENGDLFYKDSYNDKGEFLHGFSFDSSGNRYEYTQQEEQPSPKGGMEGLYRFVVKKIKYPKIAAKNGVQGRVFVQFVVDKDGTIMEVEVVKGISKECDEEALRVMKLMKKWKPGIQRGQPVKVRMIMPIMFKLP